MRTINGKIEHGIDISNEEIELNGMVVGDINVRSGGFLRLGGMVVGSVRVHSNGRLEANGTITSTVDNQGGVVDVFGIVTGAVTHVSGRSTLHQRSIVNGETIMADRILGA